MSVHLNFLFFENFFIMTGGVQIKMSRASFQNDQNFLDPFFLNFFPKKWLASL